MKSIWTAFTVVLLLNVLLVGGFFGWLHMTDRLSGERVEAVVDLFTPTVTEADAVKAAAEKQKTQEVDQAREAVRLEQIAHGSSQLHQKLVDTAMSDEVALQRYERLRREIQDLHTSIEKARQLLDKQRAELDEDKKVFEAKLAAEQQKRQDEDFKYAVKMVEQLKPKQAKDLFINLIKQQQVGQVTDYLAAMNLRKAGSVLKEFKEPAELTMATDLIERLRQRGVNLLAGI